MRVSGFVIAAFSAFCLLWPFTNVESKNEKFPSIPSATLLLGWPPHSLVIRAVGRSTTIQEEGSGWRITPSMSADGSLVASAETVTQQAPSANLRMVVSTYSVADKKWTDYEDLQIFSGTVAISPDGSKLACITAKVWNGQRQIKVLDLRSGRITTAPESANKVDTDLSWSSDGWRLAFNTKVEGWGADAGSVPPLSTIYVWNLQSGTVSKLAVGKSPSWSPSGEWIAFYDYSPGRDNPKRNQYAANANRVSLVRTDGSDLRVLVKFGNDENLSVPPVWSPDSKTILHKQSTRFSVNQRDDGYICARSCHAQTDQEIQECPTRVCMGKSEIKPGPSTGQLTYRKPFLSL